MHRTCALQPARASRPTRTCVYGGTGAVRCGHRADARAQAVQPGRLVPAALRAAGGLADRRVAQPPVVELRGQVEQAQAEHGGHRLLHQEADHLLVVGLWVDGRDPHVLTK